MSDRMTGVAARDRNEAGGAYGLELWGRRTRAEAVAEYRRYWELQAKKAARALSLTDDQLIVETYLGSWARRNCQEVTE